MRKNFTSSAEQPPDVSGQKCHDFDDPRPPQTAPNATGHLRCCVLQPLKTTGARLPSVKLGFVDRGGGLEAETEAAGVEVGGDRGEDEAIGEEDLEGSGSRDVQGFDRLVAKASKEVAEQEDQQGVAVEGIDQ
mmetsp:Transcript_8250/g.13356  ORF Transcript_8250/g.13356 Transcript_8250/m.13356 type:complete len:133 (+) Transcript_8250:1091-1489(+)